MSNLRVLIVEDDPLLASLHAEELEFHGYLVTLETDARKALEIVQQDPYAFDVIFTDQMMPHLSGIDLAFRVRKINSRIPIIMSTGWGAQISSSELNLLTINLIEKPFMYENLVALINSRVEESRS